MGIGSLGLARNYSDAGILYGTIALIIVAAVNAFSCVVLCHCLAAAPAHVKTYGDLGYYAAGKFGRNVVATAQLVLCLLLPIAFLVLGGSILLPKIFEGVHFEISPTLYIVFMALCMMPIVFLKTLEETAAIACIGTLGAVFGDVFAVVDSHLHSPFYTNAQTLPQVDHVLSVFGILTMAFGSIVIVPSIHRNHPRPENMPMLMIVLQIFLFFIYLAIGIIGYEQYGCFAPDNLLLSMTNPTYRVLGMSFFMVHIIIAYAVILNPALYIIERYVFGYGKENYDVESLTLEAKHVVNEYALVVKDGITESRIKSYLLRSGIVAVQVLVAILLQSSFNQFADLIGSTAISLAGIILPVWLYLKMFSSKMSNINVLVCWTLILLTVLISLYASYEYIVVIIRQISNSNATSDPYATCKSMPRMI